MLKRLCLALAGLFAFVSIASGAGTVPGCKLYIIQAGTTSTPQNAYQDSGLTILQPNPMVCDAAGRLSQFFVADGVIKLRLTTSTGTQIFVGDNLLVVGSSSGGGGGGTVDPTTILATGDIKTTFGTGVLSGWVRGNGKTIGSAVSGATERANADCQSLFIYLWNNNATVIGGRGATAAADWAANKTLVLPDFRSRALAGLGDMGNTDNGLFAGATFSFGNSTTLGSILGAARHTITTPNLPPYSPAGSISNGAITTTLASATILQSSGLVQVGGGGSFFSYNLVNPSATSTQAASTFNGSAQGGTSTPFDTISPFALVTIYVKL
jgi:hypothetical protein